MAEGDIPVIDRDRCKGHGRCYALAPSVFDADDDGFGVVTATTVHGAQVAELDRVVLNCPELAVSAASANPQP